jgi:uncharacterized CHY-type Zn-finger protein
LLKRGGIWNDVISIGGPTCRLFPGSPDLPLLYPCPAKQCGEWCSKSSGVSKALTRVSPHSKHILNAQVSIRAPCCKQWFDCSECHAEAETHPLARTTEMSFICKKCKKAFRKDMTVYEESDEYCPHCDNHYVRPCWCTVLYADINFLARSSKQRHPKLPLGLRERMHVLMHGTSPFLLTRFHP